MRLLNSILAGGRLQAWKTLQAIGIACMGQSVSVCVMCAQFYTACLYVLIGLNVCFS